MTLFGSDKKTCRVCMHACSLAEGQTGRCLARKNIAGEIVSISYGDLTAMQLDPIEKKPLNRFHPGSKILSVGSFGCNLRCEFCQNYRISMASEQEAETVTFRKEPQDLLEEALRLRKYGNIGIAYTYNEPTIGYEYVLETARLIHEEGMYNVLVTNGSASREILKKLLPWLDAMNIDLKCFSEEGYARLGGSLEPVKQFIALARTRSHVELTFLLVPGLNDSEDEFREMCRWIASADPNMPLHVNRFFPMYQSKQTQPTPIRLLYHYAEIAEQYLTYVYVGNV